MFLLAILIPACASSSPAFLMMYSAYKLNKKTEMSTERRLDGEEARGLKEVSLSWGARVCRLVAAVTTQETL